MSDLKNNTNHINDDVLQKLFDEELEVSDLEGTALDGMNFEALRAKIDASELEQTRLSRLERLGDLVRWSADEAQKDLDSNTLFSKIQADLTERPKLRVVQGQKRNQRVVGFAAVGLAIAAAIMLAIMWTANSGNDGEIAEHPMDDPREVYVEHTSPTLVPPSGTEVEQVDFGANTGTVFEVEGEEGQSLAVVWIAE